MSLLYGNKVLKEVTEAHTAWHLPIVSTERGRGEMTIIMLSKRMRTVLVLRTYGTDRGRAGRM